MRVDDALPDGVPHLPWSPQITGGHRYNVAKERTHGTAVGAASPGTTDAVHHAPQSCGTARERDRHLPLRIRPASPYCVRLDLASFPDEHVTWVIGRDLLLAGTEKLSGDGDVKIWPSRQRGNTPSLYLRLERPYVTAMFATELDPIRQWLMETYIAVPAGRESLLVDWDALAASRRPPT